MILHFNPLLISQSQQFIVVHNRVHVFDPQGVNIAVEEYVSPFVVAGIQRFVDLAENTAQQTICPIARRRIQLSVQLDDGASLDKIVKNATIQETIRMETENRYYYYRG